MQWASLEKARTGQGVGATPVQRAVSRIGALTSSPTPRFLPPPSRASLCLSTEAAERCWAWNEVQIPSAGPWATRLTSLGLRLLFRTWDEGVPKYRSGMVRPTDGEMIATEKVGLPRSQEKAACLTGSQWGWPAGSGERMGARGFAVVGLGRSG